MQQRRDLGVAADGPTVVEVLACNWRTVQVYQACAWSKAPVFTGKTLRWIHEGIAAAEIMAAMRGLGVPRAARQRVFEGIRVMVNAAAPVLNG